MARGWPEMSTLAVANTPYKRMFHMPAYVAGLGLSMVCSLIMCMFRGASGALPGLPGISIWNDLILWCQ